MTENLYFSGQEWLGALLATLAVAVASGGSASG